MGFEIFVKWYEHGEPASVPFDDVYSAFAPAVITREPAGFAVRYGGADESYVHAAPGPSGTLADMMIARPCAATPLWDAIVAAMRLGHALCFWPGDACAVARQDAIEHLPRDITAGLGSPHVVEDGRALARVVKVSS